MNSDTQPETPSYWCYNCTRYVHLLNHNNITCPHCESGFVEEIQHDASSHQPLTPSPDASTLTRHAFRRRRRNNSGNRSPFNPVIVLRTPGHYAGDRDRSNFDLYYDGGDGNGLRPLPPTMSEFLLGSGFDGLLEQFAQIDMNGFSRPENPPASKIAIESLPTVEIAEAHVVTDAHCAVCKESFAVGTEARELPCKHIYHSDCILPWLSLRNSCPVCRHELPYDQNPQISGQIDEEATGMTIWRLPGGGFAVGRFSGESHVPVVYTEMDGGMNYANGAPRRISRAVRSNGVRESGGIGRIFRNFLSFFGRIGSRSSLNSNSVPRRRSQLSSVINRGSRNWVLQV